MYHTLEDVQKEFGPRIAKEALYMGAIKLSPNDPFLWASGYRMPIYNDNRRLLADAKARALIAEGLAAIAEALEIPFDSIAGTATAGIPHATTLADKLEKPLCYVRAWGKDHGLKNLIEGLGSDGSFHGQRVLLIEDLISTGGSSVKAVQSIRQADGLVAYCLAIFTYGLEASVQSFAALEPQCRPIALLDYDTMVATALATGYVDGNGAELLNQWRRNPFRWGTDNGFPPSIREEK
ncbi:MAG: orotate phosphoribosyltransferase [Spirochaetae bacterium HGW-Spirochaetae-2]|jgi:orotate phosphoribosyltransferase|nr:MAG: orotate phosphoribosyltransferase [Spirochaetae bacterium HGW-Spirochaetae-2]